MIKIAEGLTVDTLSKPVIGQLHHAHCSGVVQFPDGEVFVVYYHAITEANRKQAIYGVRKLAGESSWSEPFLVSKDKPNKMEGNPVIWIAPDTGKLWLFYVESFGGWSVCNPRYKTSEDRGKTWTKFKRIYPIISRGLKNPPIITSKGWYILGGYVEFRDTQSMIFISKNQGKSWKDIGARIETKPEKASERHGTRQLLQPTVIERKDGSIFCLNRAARPLGKMYQSISTDGGLHWSVGEPGVLPNPGGGFCMIKLQSGNIAIAYNHAPAPPLNSLERNPVSIAISEDEGRSWQYRRNLCEFHPDDPENPNKNRRSFGYPTLCQGADGTIHVTWSFSHHETIDGQEYNLTDIQHVSFTEDWAKEHQYFDDAFEL